MGARARSRLPGISSAMRSASSILAGWAVPQLVSNESFVSWAAAAPQLLVDQAHRDVTTFVRV